MAAKRLQVDGPRLAQILDEIEIRTAAELVNLERQAALVWHLPWRDQRSNRTDFSFSL